MASFAAALQAGDAVRVRVYSNATDRIEQIVVNATVIEPASVRRLGSTSGHEVKVAYDSPDGTRVIKFVAAANLQPAPRRIAPAPRFGDEDGSSVDSGDDSEAAAAMMAEPDAAPLDRFLPATPPLDWAVAHMRLAAAGGLGAFSRRRRSFRSPGAGNQAVSGWSGLLGLARGRRRLSFVQLTQ
jgi:hypothetical protein